MKRTIDLYIILAVLSLLFIGTLNIFSQTQIQYKDYPLKKLIFVKHIIILLSSLFISFIFFFLDIEKLFKSFFIPISLLILVLLLIPIIFKKYVEINGSNRWISFKYFSIQPSEFSKLYLVLTFSYWFSKKKDSQYSFKSDILFPLSIATIVLFLIFIQKDLSTAFLIGMFLIITFLISGVPIPTIIYFCVLTISIFIILIFSGKYRINRILAFLVPKSNISTIAFQNYQALRFIGLGGLFGKGLGWSMSNGEYLPLSYSDFAFSGIVCEMGIIGGFFVIFCYIIIILRGYIICLDTSDQFDFFLAAFTITMLTIQVIINIAVALNMLPPTGVTLPFVSYGGSSLMVSMIFVSILIRIRYKTKLRFGLYF